MIIVIKKMGQARKNENVNIGCREKKKKKKTRFDFDTTPKKMNKQIKNGRDSDINTWKLQFSFNLRKNGDAWGCEPKHD